MAKYTEEFLEKLESATSIVEIIGFFLAVNSYGETIKCKCPFCNQKETIKKYLVVSEVEKRYRCSSCEIHGDAISFLVHFLDISYDTAIELLAKKYNVNIEYEKNKNPVFTSKQKEIVEKSSEEKLL